ncbi:MAG: galactose mutarotase [Synergistaceae bacterium]|jgi:aldose 1-epimerase|nr:galactose mutarotase [Synergistaceae bacterium]
MTPDGYDLGYNLDYNLKSDNFTGNVDGKRVDLYRLKNSNGLEACFCNYGARLLSLFVPDREGRMGDVVLGYETLEKTRAGRTEMGAAIGRYANRIAEGRFRLDGKEFRLPLNDGPNHLHGGPGGAQRAVFDAVRPDGQSVRFTLYFRDGEDGYPGGCMLKVLCALTDDNALRIDYDAVTDAPTIVNFSNHAYFNLSGAPDVTDILEHRLQLDASRYTPIDATLIPTGEIAPVAGTPFDFTTPHAIGARIEDDDEQLRFGRGYDHNFVIDRPASPLTPARAARLSEPRSGRVMEVWTTEPGIQLYTGNFLTGGDVGKGGRPMPFRGALCLETQHFPDSINHPNFPGVILRPGEWFSSTTEYRFSRE